MADDNDARGRDEEAVFARDVNDAVVRREKADRRFFDETVTLTIDGYPVTVPKNVPATDAQGNERRAADGGLVPRLSTVCDAALQLVRERRWSAEDLRARIPVLCHQPHLHPVGVCRMCVVQIQQIRRGEARTERKLLPACQHPAADDMAVTTRAGAAGYGPPPAPPAGATDEAVARAADEYARRRAEAERFAENIRASTAVLAELLLADHRHHPLVPADKDHKQPGDPDARFENELEAVAAAVGRTEARARLRRAPGAGGAAGGLDALAEGPVWGRNALAASGPADRAAAGLAAECRDRRVPLPIARLDVGDDPADPPAWERWNDKVDARFPYSSRTVVVDHDRCILCDRCVRACSEVKPFKVIGHTGKGYTTRVSFDLDRLMGESSCVQCGECMTSCPTGALSLRRRVRPRNWDDDPAGARAEIPLNPKTPIPAPPPPADPREPRSRVLTADEMRKVRLWYHSPNSGKRVVFPFASIPYAYLRWNEGAVRRWELPPGTRKVICREGEFGTTAFLLEGTGVFEIWSREAREAPKPGLLGRLLGRPAGHPDDLGDKLVDARGHELIQGEMAPLSSSRRVASVVAVAPPDNPGLVWGEDENGWPTAALDPSVRAPVVVYEVTRNLLHMMQRSRTARDELAEVYTLRAVAACVRKNQLFKRLGGSKDESIAIQRRVTAFLQGRPGLELRRLQAGEVVVAEGDAASDFYMVRLGNLRVYQTSGGRDRVLRVIRETDSFGEVALLDDPPGKRTASVAALDTAEVVRVPGGVFRDMLAEFPPVKAVLKGLAKKYAPPPPSLGEYTDLGLYQGQKVLALDLLKCTRCDECTKACADAHDGHARLLRDGRRFGDFLVATSCRSCHTPYCMDGCPVDAIHRKGDRLEVRIEDHCIGCGLCERNCPYGSIHMVPRGEPNLAALAHPDGHTDRRAAPRRAVNCDQCGPIGGEPFCVSACPHDAAFRFDASPAKYEGKRPPPNGWALPDGGR